MDKTGPSADSVGEAAPGSAKSLLPFDILRVLLHVARGWRWAMVAAVLGGGGAAALGTFSLTTKYTSQVQLVRQEVQNNFQASEIGESFRPRQFNAATVSAMMRAGPLMEKTGAGLKPPLPPAQLQEGIVIRPEKNTDLITVAWTETISPAHAAETINLYAANVVSLTKELQASEARELLGFITSQVERTESELAAVQRDMMAFSRESGLHNADQETESYLKQIGELELKIETARIERETVDYRMTQSERELAKQDPGVQRLNEARQRLAELLTQFTAQHPSVVDQQARVDALEKNTLPDKKDATAAFQSSGNTVANNLYLDILTLRGQKESLVNQIRSLQIYLDQVKAKLDTIPDKSLVQARLRGRATSLEETRNLLAGRQREAQLFAENAPGYYRLFAPATADAVETSRRTIKLALAGLMGAVLGGGLVAGVRALRAAMDDRIVSPSDVRRLTKTPVVAALPAEDQLDPAALARWRFAAWAHFVRAVPAPPDGALVAGLMSAAPGEGKSTWLRHLGRAALDRGLKVLILSNGLPTTPGDSPESLGTGLEQPESVLTHFASAEPPALELNAGPGWRWTPANRLQWRHALALWSREPGLVILVELPPASQLDSLLLAETLPAILWLSDSGTVRRDQVTGILDTIRQSGVNLIGSLLNRIPPVFQKLPDLAKFGLCLTALAAVMATSAAAQPPDHGSPPESAPGVNANDNADLPPVSPAPPPPPALPELVPGAPLPPEAPQSLLPDEGVPPPPAPPAAAAKPVYNDPKANPKLQAWQERLTLGPGDLVNLQVFGRKEYTRGNVPIGPDGTLSYLQVVGFKAAGLTIDELRAGLTTALHQFINNARVIVTPSAWRSKKYFLLGTIIDRGAYTLDRPMTLLEAAARARGIATGLMEQNTVEIADMRRAFIVRNGKKLDVDFTKLFYEGDTTQNIPLQPGDYIYFPSTVNNEAYVMGAVGSPGTIGVTENLTALGAITVRGGFTPAAWRKKVIVVRGSADPARREVKVVNAAAILAGKEKDILLQARDLVFVSEKPWQKAGEILDVALRAFVQTGAATWTGENIGPLLKDPILPSLPSE